ncbi:TonB-dependent receptor [Anditalea andensis]|uniref:TonB-dependent receptor n=1 Tax=Anditalea andensis TaxID=1048983 RepID=UPI000690E8A6|nr:TonB-dependent receptor plug domain-containing protein [Anditalea andensis]
MKSIIIWYLVFVSGAVFGQSVKLSGEVVDENGEPLRGANIWLFPDSLMIDTDRRGHFSFSEGIEQDSYLLISHIGYVTQRINFFPGQKAEGFRVVLIPSDQLLSEVLVETNPFRKQEDALNVEVVGRDFLQKYMGGSLMHTLERLPGISTIGIGSGQSKPLIRGLGFNRVVVLDKGIKHEGQQWGADHGLELDQFAAEEVELIKGAASFAYGSDAIGGAINVKPVPAPDPGTFGGSVDLIGKSNNNLLGTSINLFSRNEKLYFDTRLSYQRYGDYRVPTDVVHVYDFPVKLYRNHLRNTAGKETGFHLQAGYLGDRAKSILYFSHIYSKSGFFANAHGLEPRRVDTDLHDSSDRDIQMPNQQVDHYKIISHTAYRFSGHRLEMELGYQRNLREEYSAYVNHGYMPPVYPSEMPVSSSLERAFDKRVYSVNLRDNLSYGKHLLAVGMSGEYQDNAISGWSFLVPAFRQVMAGAFVYDKRQD